MQNIFIHATDTSYGFATTWNNIAGIKTIQKLKQRNKAKAFSLLFSDLNQLKNFCIIDKAQEKFIQEKLAKKIPSSFILEKRNNLKNYFPELMTVSCRIETEDFPVKLATLLQSPITSTSVNISGKYPLYNSEEIQETFSIHKILSPEDLEENIPKHIKQILFPSQKESTRLYLINSGNIEKKAPSSIWDLTKEEFSQIR